MSSYFGASILLFSQSIFMSDASYLDVLFTKGADGTASCTASKSTKSMATVCYRTIPLTSEDRKLRPDLRIGIYDPAIAKVARVVQWVQQMGGMGGMT